LSFALFMLAAALPRDARAGDKPTPVDVSFPRGMTASAISVTPGPDPQTKYVVIDALKVRNGSRVQPLHIDYKDFKLRGTAGDLHTVDRKRTESLHFSLIQTTLRPGQSTTGSLAFLVPASLRKATLLYHVNQFDANYSVLEPAWRADDINDGARPAR
jgi:hypothetical protein